MAKDKYGLTDIWALENILEHSELTTTFIVKEMGFSFQTFMNKRTGKCYFYKNEVDKLCELLNIDYQTKEELFFKADVPKQVRKKKNAEKKDTDPKG